MNMQSQYLDSMPQWVCLECGYNMIGEMPDVCPFCGAHHDKFMTWGEVEKKYRVTAHNINNEQHIAQLHVGGWVSNTLQYYWQIRNLGLILRYLTALANLYIIEHFILNHILRSIAMSDDELLDNQKTIISNQRTILSNQETILANQEKLDRIFSNQDQILANQEKILANQEKLDRILSNQERILAK